MTYYELWIEVLEFLVGPNNYYMIQGIGDIAFTIFALVIGIMFFLSPFIFAYIVFAFIRSLRYGRL